MFKGLISLKSLTIGLGTLLVLGVFGVSGYFIYQANFEPEKRNLAPPEEFLNPSVLSEEELSREIPEGKPFTTPGGIKRLLARFDRLVKDSKKPYPFYLYVSPEVLEVPFLVGESTRFESNRPGEEGELNPYELTQGDQILIDYEIAENRLLALRVLGGVWVKD